mgnify:CR=1 FL=1
MTRRALQQQWLPTKQVIIPFIGPSGRATFPTGAWDIWAPAFSWNTLQGRTPTCWFELHRRDWYTQPKTWRREYGLWLQTQVERPVVMWEKDHSVLRSVEYPLADVLAAHPAPGPLHGPFDWLMALALCLNAHEIAVWGVDYDDLHEKLYQQPGAAYWVGYARGCGITVPLSPGCTLLDTPMPPAQRYGQDYPPWPAGHHPDDYPCQYQEARKVSFIETTQSVVRPYDVLPLS